MRFKLMHETHKRDLAPRKKFTRKQVTNRRFYAIIIKEQRMSAKKARSKIMKICKSCGKEYKGEYCEHCGYGDPKLKTHAADNRKQNYNKTTIALFISHFSAKICCRQ